MIGGFYKSFTCLWSANHILGSKILAKLSPMFVDLKRRAFPLKKIYILMLWCVVWYATSPDYIYFIWCVCTELHADFWHPFKPAACVGFFEWAETFLFSLILMLPTDSLRQPKCLSKRLRWIRGLFATHTAKAAERAKWYKWPQCINIMWAVCWMRVAWIGCEVCSYFLWTLTPFRSASKSHCIWMHHATRI